MPLYARVAIDLPLHKQFIYSVPNDLSEQIKPFQLVKIPFGNRLLIGIITELLHTFPSTENITSEQIKPIFEILDSQPRLSGDMYSLVLWMADYYLASIGETLFSVTSGHISKKKTASPLKQNQQPASQTLPLNPLSQTQEHIFSEITGQLNTETAQYSLLYGVTGSGKTEIYLKLIEKAIHLGRSVIFLVPEIALSYQTIDHVKKHFSNIAVLHSRMTPVQKHAEWKLIASGEKNIVVGPRSAIFAPVKKLGLIIIDEEHSAFYKEHSSPRYHARQVAFMRAKHTKSLLLLGSATPSIESLYLAKKGFYNLFELKERYKNAPLPQVTVLQSQPGEELLHETLIERIQGKLDKKQQVILFLNKRGFADVLLCSECGHIFKCDACDISYTYHRLPTRFLQCHYCGMRLDIPTECPKCKSLKLRPFGAGTQKIELSLKKLFPDAAIGRFDYDNTRKKGEAYALYTDFLKKKIDILVGTQMIGHGFHFPEVTLVGVVGFEMMLNWPDFRSVENTLSLLFQISGRAGRGTEAGEVYIQSKDVELPFLKHLISHDYIDFYNEEIALRQQCLYPPFSRLVHILIKGKTDAEASDSALKIGQFLKTIGGGISILGPSPAPIAKIGNVYRYHLILKFLNRSKEMNEKLLRLKQYIMQIRIRAEMDIDPISLI